MRHQYCLLADDPQHLRDTLEEAGVDSRIYYATLAIGNKSMRTIHSTSSRFRTDDIAHRLVAIPVFHQMTDDEVERVIRRLSPQSVREARVARARFDHELSPVISCPAQGEFINLLLCFQFNFHQHKPGKLTSNSSVSHSRPWASFQT